MASSASSSCYKCSRCLVDAETIFIIFWRALRSLSALEVFGIDVLCGKKVIVSVIPSAFELGMRNLKHL